VLERYVNDIPQLVAQLATANRERFAALLADMVTRPVETLVLLGCGTSLNVAAMLAAGFDGASRLRVQAHNAFEWLAYAGIHEASTTAVVGFSQSGESSTTIGALRRAADQGCLTVAITAQPESTLAGIAGHMLDTACPDEPRGPKTKGFVAALHVGIELMARAVVQVGGSEAALRQAGVRQAQADRPQLLPLGPDGVPEPSNLLPSARLIAETIDDNRGRARQLAPMLVAAEPLAVVGGGPAYGLAQEVALKLQEIAKLHAVAYEVEEAMHGPVYAMDSRAVALVISQPGASAARAARFMAGIRQIGASVVRAGPWESEAPELVTPSWDERSSALLLAGPLQLLAIEAARLRGVSQSNPYPNIRWDTKTFHRAP
jgi:glutamine---fructose-6-phosphate transaminase (isomerizing)